MKNNDPIYEDTRKWKVYGGELSHRLYNAALQLECLFIFYDITKEEYNTLNTMISSKDLENLLVAEEIIKLKLEHVKTLENGDATVKLLPNT